jgi:Dehydrogenases with different specificities (related to short-chain alcohol dehydrogenases)
MTDYSFPGIDGRTAVVTGAARGIGRGIAEALVDHGARVASIDIDWPSDASPTGTAFTCDISDQTAVQECFDHIEQHLGPVTILVNNAAILRPSSLLDLSLADWQRSLDINVTGAFLCTKRAIASMKQERYGRIVNIGSNSGKMGGTTPAAAYAASKAALHNLARTVASEFARDGITANAVAACLIDTDMARGAGLDELIQKVPVGRMGTVDDVAFATLFFCSSAASYITAEVMDVNGGYYID